MTLGRDLPYSLLVVAALRQAHHGVGCVVWCGMVCFFGVALL